MAETLDWPPPRRPSRGRGRLFALVVAGLLLLSGGTALSYYVDALWFDSLGVDPHPSCATNPPKLCGSASLRLIEIPCLVLSPCLSTLYQ